MPTLVLNTGFEHGLGTGADAKSASLTLAQGPLIGTISGSPTVEAAAARSGNYGLRCGATNLVEQVSWGAGTGVGLPTGGTVFVARFYFKCNGSLPNGDTHFARIGYEASIGSAMSSLHVDNNGVMTFRVDGSTIDTGPTIVADTWYRIEFRCTKTSNTNLSMDWQVDGIDYGNFNGTPSQTLNNTIHFRQFSLGYGVSDRTYDFMFDDLALSYTSADYPLGPGYTEGVKPDTFSGLTLHTSGVFVRDATTTPITSADASRLDDDPFGGTTDYIRQTTGSSTQPGGSVKVNFGTSGTSTVPVNGVRAMMQYGAASTNANTVRIWGIANGVNTYLHGSSSTQPTVGSLGPVYASAQLNNGGVAWTDTMADGVQIAFGTGGGTDVNPVPRYDNAMLEIDWLHQIAYPVTDLLATPGNAQAVLSWTAPNDRGVAITDYERRYALNDVRLVIGVGGTGGSGSPAAAKGQSFLAPSTSVGSVDINLSAFGTDRDALISLRSTIGGAALQTVTVPNASISTDSAGSTVRAVFSNPATLVAGNTYYLTVENTGGSTGAIIIGYTASSEYASGTWYDGATPDASKDMRLIINPVISWSSWASTGSSSPGTTVTGLTNDMEYLFQVRAINSAGSGDASNTAAATPSAAGVVRRRRHYHRLPMPVFRSVW